MPTPRAVPLRIHDGKARMCVPVPKWQKAKHGKRAPNATERKWMDWIVAYGCICCRVMGHAPRPTAVHHMLRGGVRLGHLFTLPLCDPGHHQGGEQFGLISRHPNKAAFEKAFGTEAELFDSVLDEYRAQAGAKACGAWPNGWDATI